MTRYGIGTLLLLLLLPIIFSIGAWMTGKQSLFIFSAISLLFFFFTCYFFRDPKREIPESENLVVSPADGRVIEIASEHEPVFFKCQVTRVSIFLSVFDVHINRIPMSGMVTYYDYQRGRYHPAFKAAASSENEQTVIGIESSESKILFKQIAGILARRIVCDLRAGHEVRKGERFGMIKFGSRMDIFFPENIKINVTLNQRVKGGETVIGTINEK